jgi:hypothetical protein
MTGNAVSTISGIAQHTVGEGGETVYIHAPDHSQDAILYSSDVVKNATWVAGILNNHTCVYFTFQLQRPGVVPVADRLDALEARLDALEAK